MEKITQDDIIIVLKAAVQLANADENFHMKEKSFFKDIIHAGNIKESVVKKVILPNTDDIIKLSNQLSSRKAKRAFLLTLSAMALADAKIDPKEREILDSLSRELDVGKIRLAELTFEDCEAMVLTLIAEGNPKTGTTSPQGKDEPKVKTGQLSDLDILMR